MPDRDQEALAARNRATLLSVRTPPGLKARVEAVAEGTGESLADFVTLAVENELRRRGEDPGPDIRYFARSGTWVKPAGAARVDVVAQGGGAGSSTGFPGQPGQLTVTSLAPGSLPATVKVTVGKGGRPGGRDGYVLVITHLNGDTR